MAEAKWIILNKKADCQAMADALGIDLLTARLLANRGADTAEKAGTYLHGTMADLHDPSLLKGAPELVGLLAEALARGEKVAVASDYDADGIFSGTILKEALERLGAEVRVYTPDRISEGYGMNRRIVDEAKAFGAGVILTCDNGISAYDAVTYAKSLGMTVLVTDHHEEPEAGLPAADALVDPKQEGDTYPFPNICGAFVAWKVMCLLYRTLGRPQEDLLDLVPYAAIATVTDVMDLVEENRILVREGLKMLKETKQPGLRAMLAVTGLEGRNLSAYHLGFVLGPCFNAAGRLETVETVQQLLAAPGAFEALPYAKKLQDLNDLRKTLTEEGRRTAADLIAREGLDRDRILVVHLPDVHESVAGIIAGRLRETWSRPVLVITGKGDTVKGSGRSTEAYNLYEGLEACRDLLDKYGGHAMAAGFSLPAANVEPRYSFPSRMTAPPMAVPRVMTAPLRTPFSEPCQSSARAAHLPSFSTLAGRLISTPCGCALRARAAGALKGSGSETCASGRSSSRRTTGRKASPCWNADRRALRSRWPISRCCTSTKDAGPCSSRSCISSR